MKRFGVLDVQGDITEHLDVIRVAAENTGVSAEVVIVNTSKEVEKLDALVIPGGESTTLGKLVREYGIDDSIKKLASKGVPIMGTCAGMILLAKDGGRQAEKTSQPLLGLMDIKVDRNAFGRQRESFEADLKIPAVGEKPFHGVFIRAPVVEKVWGGVKELCKYDGRIVMVQQNNLLGIAFHPELSGDTRIHEYFLRMVKK
ncbi:MAG: pyridoxal 5'-phosphate synthase glutaminase subunit PdxT [Candidatus Altiarchaeota archaeon]|nr:pyridoxal 5'-phosphate synthase glutaminase subunit PdxT [Candidatus Altiarchaeota archaeon]